MATAGIPDTPIDDVVREDEAPSAPELPMERHVSEKLLAKLADRVYPQHLYVFATQLLNVRDAKFFQIIDGTQNNPWQRCHNVSCQSFSTFYKIFFFLPKVVT